MEKLKWIIWDQIILSIALTIMVKDPCKGKKCLVKGCCQEYCELKTEYLKFCDREGNIKFQRFCAISIVTTSLILVWGIYKFFKEIM